MDFLHLGAERGPEGRLYSQNVKFPEKDLRPSVRDANCQTETALRPSLHSAKCRNSTARRSRTTTRPVSSLRLESQSRVRAYGAPPSLRQTAQTTSWKGD